MNKQPEDMKTKTNYENLGAGGGAPGIIIREKQIKKKFYICNNCGFSLTNRSTWCDMGCGSDYNEMIEVKGMEQALQDTREEAYKEVIKLNEELWDCIELGIRLKDKLKKI